MGAYDIAKRLHKGQMYGGKDYFKAHICDVVDRIKASGSLGVFASGGHSEFFDELDIIYATAYLHDVLEDCGVTEIDLRRLLSKDYKHSTNTIIEAVAALTKREGEDYNTYMSRVMQNKYAAFVKYYDSESNMYACICDGDNRRAQKYLNNMCILKDFV